MSNWREGGVGGGIGIEQFKDAYEVVKREQAWPTPATSTLSNYLGLRTVSLTDTAVQSTGIDGGGSTSVRPFGSTEQHQMETDGYKTAVNGCRRPSIVLTSTKMIIIISILGI